VRGVRFPLRAAPMIANPFHHAVAFAEAENDRARCATRTRVLFLQLGTGIRCVVLVNLILL
jgi:hypothetical protein